MARTLIKNLKGSTGPTGPMGPVNPDSAPTDTAIAGWISTAGGSATQTAGDARYASSNADMSFMSTIGDPFEGATQAAAVGSEKKRITNLFATTGSNVAIGRRGTTYDLYQELYAGVWWRQALQYYTPTNGSLHAMGASMVGVPCLTLDQGDPSFVYSATGWSTTTNALTYGGSYARNLSTVGSTVTWTTPVATKIGLRAFRTTNGGYAKVTIDGSATAATFLPTAQDEVTAGRLASTALVAGGGTLNPTDRVYNSYGATSDNDVMVLFTEGLTSAAHTLVMTMTGYKQGTSTDIRMYISGGIYASAATVLTTLNTELAPYVVVLAGTSVSEFAVTYRKTGSASTAFIGNYHGNEVEDTFVITNDGATITPADGSIVLGANAVITRTSHLVNPDNGTETVATVTCQWAMSNRGGLNVHWNIDWSVAGSALATYAAMLPTEGNTFQKGRAAAGSVVTMLNDDNAAKGSTPSDTLVLWQDGGKGAVMATLRNLPTAVNRWENATDYAWLQDRTGGDFNKGYFQRVQAGLSESVAIGDKWEGYITYRAGWLSTTAPLAL